MIRGVGRRKGFTMTEVAVVVVIIIVVVAIGAPRFFGSISVSRTEMAAQQAKNAFVYARQIAITSRDRVAAVANGGWNRIEVRNADQADAVIRVFGLPTGTTVLAGNNTSILFHPRGICVPAGSVVVGDNERAYRVIVNVAGRVRVEEHLM